MKKKYLALCYKCESSKQEDLNTSLHTNYLLITKFSEKFDKIYLINFKNLIFFPQKNNETGFKLNRNLNIPSNIEFYTPTSSKEFKDFMVGKTLIGINMMGTTFRCLKIYFLTARHKIKLVQITNVGNIQSNMKILEGFFWKGLLYKFSHDYGHKFTVLLSNLGLVSKMEIRFTTDNKFIEYKTKGKNFLKKIFNYFNLHYAKEFILINSRAFDAIKESQIEIEENKIVQLDEMFDNIQWTLLKKKLDQKDIENHYCYLVKLLKNLSSIYKKEVVICIHPSDNLELKKKLFADFKVVKYQTRENIFKAFLVLFFESGAIIDAILLKKRIVTLLSKIMDENQIKHGEDYMKTIGTIRINVEDEITFNKDDFLLKLDKTKKKYFNFIKNSVAPDGDNISSEKIIKIIKERFFN